MMKLTAFLSILVFGGALYAQDLRLVWGEGGEYYYPVMTSAGKDVLLAGNFYDAGTFGPAADQQNVVSNGQGDFFLEKIDSLGNIKWSKHFGGTGYEMVKAVATDVDGSILLTGRFDGAIDFDPGIAVVGAESSVASLFVIKLDSNGSFLWGKNYGPEFSEGYGVDTDQWGNIFIAGSHHDGVFYDEVALIKLNSAGEMDWTRKFHGPYIDSSNDIAVDEEGSVYATGIFHDTMYYSDIPFISNGSSDLFVVKFDNSGNFKWRITLGGEGFEHWGVIDTDSENNVFWGGSYWETMDSDAGTGSSIIQTTQTDSWGAFLQKLTTDGETIWTRTLGGISENRAYDLALDSADNCYVTGPFSGTIVLGDSTTPNVVNSLSGEIGFVQKWSTSGQPFWGTVIPSTGYCSPGTMAVNDAGNIYLSGFLEGISTSGDGDYVIVMDNTVWDNEERSFVAMFGCSLGTHIDWYPWSYGESDVIADVSMNSVDGSVVITQPQEKALEIKVVDLTGRVVYKMMAETKVTTLDLSGLSTSSYQLVLSQGGKQTSKLFLLF